MFPATIDINAGKDPRPANRLLGKPLVKYPARLASSAALVTAGAVFGLSATAPFGAVTAQDAAPAGGAAVTVDISEANAEKIKQANDSLATAQAALIQDGSYREAIGGLNPYAVLAGGVDAITDLESGRGVDPITFAGLHTGLAIDEVTPHLAFDANGRLTYKGKLVRMYPPERMKQLLDRQQAVLTATAGSRRVGAGATDEPEE